VGGTVALEALLLLVLVGTIVCAGVFFCVKARPY
jgi:hypothetical protein